MSDTPQRIARALFRSVALPGAMAPYDRLMLRIYYPALPDDSDEQRNSGVVAVDTTGAPYPLVVVLPGINVGPECYAWLAAALAVSGHVVVTYSMIAEEMPGYVSLTPGLDLEAIAPGSFGTRPSATALAALLGAMHDENSSGLLEGSIDTDDVALVGHSAGGSVALYNADPAWFPGLKSVVVYGAHAGASTMLGFDEGTILPLPSQLPVLLIGGTHDGVIAGSAHRYGDQGGDPLARVRDTFEHGIRSDRGDSFLVEVDGANHFSFAHPFDGTTGRAFLDWPQTADGEDLRATFALLIERFFAGDYAAVREFASHKLVAALHAR